MLKTILNKFNENIEGLKDFAELIKPFLEEHIKKESEKHSSAIRPVNLAIAKHLEEDEEKAKKLDKELKDIFDGEIEVNSEIGEDDEIKSLNFKFLSGDAESFNLGVKAIHKSSSQIERLYKSSLISLISSVEWFFAQLLHFYYNEYPNSAGIKNKTLTLSDLKGFDTIKDAEQYLVEELIDKSVRSGFSDWTEILKKDLNLSMGYLKDYKDEIVEVFQRRNILVHNNGIINSTYLSKVNSNFTKDLKLGDRIEINDEYLFKSMNQLHLVFSLFALELWKNLEPENESRGEFTMDLGYKYLCKEDYKVANSANLFLTKDKKMAVASRTAAELNLWLCKKREKGLQNISKDLDKIDYSDKALIFQIALMALKEDEEKFFKNLPQVLKTEELKPNDLFEFPIFKEMRETNLFEEFCEKEKSLMPTTHITNS